MNPMWQKALGTAMLVLVAAAPLTGCGARPAPRPEAGTANPGVVGSADLNTAVARTAMGVSGTGTVETVVVGTTALVAIQLQDAAPGGTSGAPITGTIRDWDGAGTSPGGGPDHLQGPGGSPGMAADPAMPGGGLNPGGSSPGGTPNFTQAVPNSKGGDATLNNAPGSPYPNPGSYHATPMDVFTRVSDQIRERHPQVAEVRFTTVPTDALRVAEIARLIREGNQAADLRAELDAIAARAIPAGTYQFDPASPPQGDYPGRPTDPVRQQERR